MSSESIPAHVEAITIQHSGRTYFTVSTDQPIEAIPGIGDAVTLELGGNQ